MLKYLNIYKPLGYTPYQMVQRVKELYPNLADTKIGYAGRLDPMAEGVLLLLIGETNRNKKEFEKLDKVYKFEALLGLHTDSYDLLGIVQQQKPSIKNISDEHIKEAIKALQSQTEQEYPPYSSVRVQSKPLFYWAREGKLNQVIIPKKNISITHIEVLSHRFIKSDELQDIIRKRISLVKGNFRQDEILKRWELFFQNNPDFKLPLYKCSIHCSSGTYIRGLVEKLGKILGTNATTLSIKRVAVGSFDISDSEDVFTENTR